MMIIRPTQNKMSPSQTTAEDENKPNAVFSERGQKNHHEKIQVTSWPVGQWAKGIQSQQQPQQHKNKLPCEQRPVSILKYFKK